MTAEQGLVVVTGALLVASALYGGYRAIRRIVHFFDAFEVLVSNTGIAVDLVIHEFKANGGRLERPITSEEAAQRATIKDLMLDTRALLTRQGAQVKALSERTDKQSEALLEAIQKGQGR